MHKWCLGIAIALVWIGASYSALATTSSLNPVADTFVTSAQPNGNFGAGGALEVSAAGLPKGQFQSLMRFDLSSTKTSFDMTFGAGQWQIQSATLQLTTANPSPQPVFNANAVGACSVSWMQNDAWAEGTGSPNSPTSDGVTFNTLPSFLSASDEALGSINFPGGTGGANVYTLGLTSGFLNDVSAGDNVSLRLLAGDTVVSYLFNARNFGTVSARPLLTIEAQPVPETFCVVLIGAIALAKLRRRRPV